MSMSENFGDQLKKWRGKLYQKEAAEKLGLSLWTYKNYELKRRVPWHVARKALLAMMTQNPPVKNKS